jgi:hypothetical protein
MQLQTGKPQDASRPPQRPGQAGAAHANSVAGINTLLRSTLTSTPVPRSAPCLPPAGEQAEAAAEEIDRWALLEQCYREHMARRALEELFAAGEMWPFDC